MKSVKFRAWTGSLMMYQENQYLASFIRRVVPQIILDHGGAAYREHESYLPNGGNIGEYLQQFTGLKDRAGKEIYEGDILYVNAGDPEQQNILGYVIWDDISGGFYVRLPHDQELNQTFVDDDMMIVGNIYEHPDMVERRDKVI